MFRYQSHIEDTLDPQPSPPVASGGSCCWWRTALTGQQRLRLRVLPPFWKIPCHSVFSQPAKIELTSGSCHFFQQQQMGWLHRLISKWDPTDILPCISTAFLLKVGFTCARSPVRVWILFSGWNASRLCRRCVEEFQWCPVVVSNEPVDICPYWCLRRTAIRNY